MNAGWTVVAVCATFTICYYGLVFERWCIRREQERPPADTARPGPWTTPTAAERPAPALETGEQASLAALAVRYAHGNQAAGTRLADYLRIKHPGLADVEIARMLIALHHVGRSFDRITQPDHHALAAYLEAIGSAALQLSAFDRLDMPS